MALQGYNLKVFKDDKGRHIPFRKLTPAQKREIGYGTGIKKGLEWIKNTGLGYYSARRALTAALHNEQGVRGPYSGEGAPSVAHIAKVSPEEKRGFLNGVFKHGFKGKMKPIIQSIDQIPGEYESLFNQVTVGIPSDDITEIIDELSGFKIVTTKDIHGNIVSQKRVVIPLSGAEQQKRDTLLNTINSTMTRMNTLMQDDPEFNITEPLQQFASFVSNIRGKSAETFNNLFGNLGIENFNEQMDSFKNNYANKFEDEMRLSKEKGREDLINRGFGEESSAYQDYMSRMDTNSARGKTDIARDSEVYGDRLLDNQLQRNLGVYSKELEKDRFAIGAESQALDRTLQGKQATLDNRFKELENLQRTYALTSGDYNNLMGRFNESQQTLGQYMLQNKSGINEMNRHRDTMVDAREKNANQRYGIDKNYQANLDNVNLAKHLERKKRVSSFKAGLQDFAFTTAGLGIGNKMGWIKPIKGK